MTMGNTLSALFVRGKSLLQKEGVIPLFRRGFAYLAQYFFAYGTYYLYEHTMKERNETDFLPKIEDFKFQIISTHQHADELAASGFDLGSTSIDARRRLDKGAIVFCVLIEKEIAHLGWVAMTEEAKNTFDSAPYRVDFSNKEACTGDTWTNTKYRGKGLMVYGYFKRLQFLRERGITVTRCITAKNNIASQMAHAKFDPKICGEARYLKILWWKFWTEKPLLPD